MLEEIKTNTKPIRIMLRHNDQKEDEKEKKDRAPFILIYKCEETGRGNYLKGLVSDINAQYGNYSKYFLDRPVVYIHAWTTVRKFKDKTTDRDIVSKLDKIYIGEAENLITRQDKHWQDAKKKAFKDKKEKWQVGLIEDKDEDDKNVIPVLYVIACNYFTKSMTLEIENKLINYAMSMNSSGKRPETEVQNGRYNPQREYFGSEYTDVIFGAIWKELHRLDGNFFPEEKRIQKSVFYKMSPHHKLNDEQKAVKRFINERCTRLMGESSQTGQLILVEGESGTGKSVLTAITLFELIHDSEFDVKLLINHAEQNNVFKDMISKLGLGEDVVYTAATYIDSHNTFEKPDAAGKAPADILFVDEAHLLFTNWGNGYYRKDKSGNPDHGKYQIDELLKRSRITVLLFDEFQALKKDYYLEEEYIERLRKLAGDNRYILSGQERMKCSAEQKQWIDSITGLGKNNKRVPGKIEDIPPNGEYEIKIFDDPQEMYKAIKQKAESKDKSINSEKDNDPMKPDKRNNGLSRMITTYDWIFDKKDLPQKEGKYTGDFYRVFADDSFSIPWEYQYSICAKKIKNGELNLDDIQDAEIRENVEKLLNSFSKSRLDNEFKKPWQEQEQTIYEIGSTYTIQGFDLEYAGVILGPSVGVNAEDNTIKFDIKAKKGQDKEEKKETGYKVMCGKREGKDIGDILLKNELRVLLTRGTKGLYIYACDKDLRKALIYANRNNV